MTKAQMPPSLQAHHYRQLAFYRPQNFLLTLLGWLLFSLMPLVIGYLNQQLFDKLSGAAQVGVNVWTLLAFLLTAEIVGKGITLGWLYRQITWEAVMMALMRSNLFANMLAHFGRSRQPNTISSGDAVNRFRDDIDATDEVANDWYRLIGHGLFALIALTYMWRINPLVTVAATLPLSGIAIVVHHLGARLAAAWQQRSEDGSRVTGFISAIFDAVQAVQVAVAEAAVTHHFDRLNEARRRSALHHTLIDNVIRSFNANVINSGRALVLLLAAQAIHAGTFTVGDFALFVIYLEEFLELPRRIGRLLGARKTSAVSSSRLLALMGETQGETTANQTIADQLVEPREIYLEQAAPLIEPVRQLEPLQHLTVQGLTYHYPENGRGIDQIDLHLTAGSLTVITGRVGAGKSTMLRALLGLLPADAGAVYWNGQRVIDPASFFTPPNVAYTPQTPHLFSATLRENILLGLPEDQRDLATALRLAVFADDVAQMAQGLDTLVGPRGVRLSGGQLQRAAAARMFVRNAQLLVFDDLASALDVETEQTLWTRLFAQQPDAGAPTCLAVSHRRVALQRADQIIVLKEGKVEDKGRLDELLARCPEMQWLWHGKIG